MLSTRSNVLAAALVAFSLSALGSSAARADTIKCEASLAGPPAKHAADAGTPADPGKAEAKAKLDLDKMEGEIEIELGGKQRHFKVKGQASEATYVLLFEEYEKGDDKPAAEALHPGKSIVARLVAYGDTNHLFFDGDVKLAARTPMGGYVCK